MFSVEIFAQTKNTKPNIIVILTDDQGLHDVSYYGTKDIRTPYIDGLCKDGLRFDNFYSNSPVCSPSRASLLAGCYPEMVGVPGLIRSEIDKNFGYLKPNVELLPALLKRAGYHTAAIGKWNLGLETPNLPNEKGFDLFHGFLDDMMNDYWNHLRKGKNFMRKNDKIINPKGHATDLFTQWAVDYIYNKEKDSTPFFLYLSYNAPHFPVQPPVEWLDKVLAREPNVSERRAKLIALIEHLDDGIGKVVNALKKTGAYENTLIVFLSDNGGRLEDGANNGPWRDGKESVYEGGIRVPAVFTWPKKIAANTVTKQKAMSMDILPTIADITKTSLLEKVDGVSLLPVLNKPNKVLPVRPLFFIRREGNMRYGGQTIQAVIHGNWKLLQNSPYAPREMYNLYEDPLEERNLINTRLEKLKKLHELMIKQIQRGGSVPWQKAE